MIRCDDTIPNWFRFDSLWMQNKNRKNITHWNGRIYREKLQEIEVAYNIIYICGLDWEQWYLRILQVTHTKLCTQVKLLHIFSWTNQMAETILSAGSKWLSQKKKKNKKSSCNKQMRNYYYQNQVYLNTFRNQRWHQKLHKQCIEWSNNTHTKYENK